MMANDRGTKKWTSLMLTEHVEMLQDVWEEAERVEKPVIDEQEILSIEENIRISLRDSRRVDLKVYDQYKFNYLQGRVRRIDHLNKLIQLDDGSRFKFTNILAAELC